MDQPALTPTNDSLSARPAPPPLRIHHLLVCIAVVGLMLTIWGVQFFRDAFEQMSAASASMFAIRYAVRAAGLTLALFSIYWHFKGYAALVQPGQWLLLWFLFNAVGGPWAAEFHAAVTTEPAQMASLVSAAANLLAGCNTFLLVRLPDINVVAQLIPPTPSPFFLILQVLYLGVPLLFLAWLAWRVADTRRWRFFFALLAFIILCGFVGHRLHLEYEVVNGLQCGIASSALVWAIADDVAAGRRRYWTHWAGATLFAAGQLLTLTAIILFRLR